MADTGEELLERVLEVIDEVFKTDSEFTKLCNVPHNFVTRAKSRGYLNPTAETLVYIYEGVKKKSGRDLNWNWLLRGEGSMFEIDLASEVERKDTDIADISAEDLIRSHPELNRKMSLLMSQVEMTRDFLKGFTPQ